MHSENVEGTVILRT